MLEILTARDFCLIDLFAIGWFAFFLTHGKYWPAVGCYVSGAILSVVLGGA